MVKSYRQKGWTADDDSFPTPAELERSLRHRFGFELENLIRQHYRSYAEKEPRSFGPAFAFRVASVQYGSAVLTVDALNPLGLIDFFKDVDVLTAALEQFSVPAFKEAIKVNYDNLVELSAAVVLSPELVGIFTAKPPGTTDSRDTSSAEMSKQYRL